MNQFYIVQLSVQNTWVLMTCAQVARAYYAIIIDSAVAPTGSYYVANPA